MPDRHQKIVRELSAQMREASGKRVKFSHKSSNTTRNANSACLYIDVSDLNAVLEVNPRQMYVITEPNVPMDVLVNETLRHGLLPGVVMEFPGITVGGGIEGSALESSSFRNGQFSDSCIEYEVILADGTVMNISPDNHQDLFYGMHGSYGSLCLLTKVKLKVVPAKPYVRTTYTPFYDIDSLLDAMIAAFDIADYVEGIVYSSEKSVLITGTKTEEPEEPIQTFSKRGDPWFYSHVDKMTEGRTWHETIPIRDHLFRYNLGAFWMGEYIYTISKIPHNTFTNWLFHPFFNTRKLMECLHEFNVGHEFLIQDFYIPFDKAKEFIGFVDREAGIYPLWICPVKSTRKMEKLSPHRNDADMMIDIGVWGRNRKFLSDRRGLNKKLERKTHELHGKKMLYAQQYYSEDEFWRIYDKRWYEELRKRYNASFPDIYEKTKEAGSCKATPWKGFWKALSSFIHAKNLNT